VGRERWGCGKRDVRQKDACGGMLGGRFGCFAVGIAALLFLDCVGVDGFVEFRV